MRRRELIANQGGRKLKYHWDYTQGLTNDIFTIETTGSSTYELTANGLKMNTYGNWEKVYLNLNSDMVPLFFQKPFRISMKFADLINGYNRGEVCFFFIGNMQGAFLYFQNDIRKYTAEYTYFMCGSHNGYTFTFGGNCAENTSYWEEGNWRGVFAWQQTTPARLYFFHHSSNVEHILQSVDIEIG